MMGTLGEPGWGGCRIYLLFLYPFATCPDSARRKETQDLGCLSQKPEELHNQFFFARKRGTNQPDSKNIDNTNTILEARRLSCCFPSPLFPALPHSLLFLLIFFPSFFSFLNYPLLPN